MLYVSDIVKLQQEGQNTSVLLIDFQMASQYEFACTVNRLD